MSSNKLARGNRAKAKVTEKNEKKDFLSSGKISDILEEDEAILVDMQPWKKAGQFSHNGVNAALMPAQKKLNYIQLKHLGWL